MSTSEKSSGRTPPTASGIESQLGALQQRVEELKRVQATSRRVTAVLAAIVVLEFAAFAFYTSRGLRQNFRQEDVQKAVAARVPEVTPVLRDHLVTVVQNTLPVYRDQATQRFQKVGPDVARDALDRLQKLPEENGKELNKHLQIAFEAALSRLEPDMKSAFPSLSDEQKTSIIHSYFISAIHKENETIAKHVNEIADNELTQMKQVLDKFDVPSETTPAAQRARQREFLHALVDVMMDGEFTLKTPPTTKPASVAAAK
jgi:hypothetical protein